MATKQEIREALETADNAQPYAEFSGIKIMSYEDCVAMTKADAITGDDIDVSERIMDENTGLPARSRTRYAAVNPDKMFDNRVRYVERDNEKVMQVVVDKRAIHEQHTGMVYQKRIVCYEIKRNSKKELEFVRTNDIEDKEFVAEFTTRLDNASMLEILPLIDGESNEISKEKIGI